MDSTDLSNLIRSKNYVEVANIFAKALPDGNPAEFLERVIEALNGGLSHKKSKASTSDNATSPSSEGKAPYILNDAVDDSAITLALQIPEDMNLMAYIIGAKGINVMNIGKSSGTKIQVEKVGTRGADQYRHLFIMGSIKNVLRAYQAMIDHIVRKDPSFPEITRMIVPNEVVAHIIGKGGVLIKELSTIASIQRIDIQQEVEMNRMSNGFYGRSVIVSGDFKKRLHVVYLLLRQLVQDSSLPSVWKGEALSVLFPQGWNQQSNGGSSMGSNMYPKHDQGSYPQGGGGMSYPGGQNMFYPNPREPMNPPPMGMGGAVYANTIKVDVQVPSDKACLGHIIGPKGAFIVEMERSTQCSIKIEKDYVEGTNPAERKVTVSGSNMVQISQAVDLVNNKVEEWRRNYSSGGSGSYRAPDDPKPYWDAPKASGGGFSTYPTQQQQYPQSQYSTAGASTSQSQYPSQGQGLASSQGQTQYASNQTQSQYPLTLPQGTTGNYMSSQGGVAGPTSSGQMQGGQAPYYAGRQ